MDSRYRHHRITAGVRQYVVDRLGGLVMALVDYTLYGTTDKVADAIAVLRE